MSNPNRHYQWWGAKNSNKKHQQNQGIFFALIWFIQLIQQTTKPICFNLIHSTHSTNNKTNNYSISFTQLYFWSSLFPHWELTLTSTSFFFIVFNYKLVDFFQQTRWKVEITWKSWKKKWDRPRAFNYVTGERCTCLLFTWNMLRPFKYRLELH